MKNKSYADYIVKTVPVEIRREWGIALKKVSDRLKQMEQEEKEDDK